jgi:hypothetical protein
MVVNNGVSEEVLPDANEVLVVSCVGRVSVGFNQASENINRFRGTQADGFTQALRKT